MASYGHGSEKVADSYAKTLLALTEEAGTTGAVVEQFRQFADFMERDASLSNFLTSHAVDTARRAAVLEMHFRGRMEDVLLNTLQVINRKGRSALIPLIYAQYYQAVEAAHNEVDVHVTSAVPLSDAAREKLAQAATKLAGKTAKLVEKVDADIIGGLVVRIGDNRLDASVARRLEGLGTALHERLVHEIHGEKAFVETNGG